MAVNLDKEAYYRRIKRLYGNWKVKNAFSIDRELVMFRLFQKNTLNVPGDAGRSRGLTCVHSSCCRCGRASAAANVKSVAGLRQYFDAE